MSNATPGPKKLTDKGARERARSIRERQWRFMERVAEHGILWFCVWNKRGLPELADEWRDGLVTGMEILDWIKRHRDWFIFGRWNETRYAAPVKLKPAGRSALAARTDDMSPVFGGMVEPGWQCVPLPRRAALSKASAP